MYKNRIILLWSWHFEIVKISLQQLQSGESLETHGSQHFLASYDEINTHNDIKTTEKTQLITIFHQKEEAWQK